MSDPTEVIAAGWELPYEVRTVLTHNWTDEAIQILKERFTRDVLAALRSNGFEVYRPEDCLTCDNCGLDGCACGTYRLVPVSEGTEQ